MPDTLRESSADNLPSVRGGSGSPDEAGTAELVVTRRLACGSEWSGRSRMASDPGCRTRGSKFRCAHGRLTEASEDRPIEIGLDPDARPAQHGFEVGCNVQALDSAAVSTERWLSAADPKPRLQARSSRGRP